MARRLCIHIGHYKTGTTILQYICAYSRGPLARAGLDYARIQQHNDKHSHLAFALLRAAGVQTLMHGYKQKVTPETLWQALIEYTVASKHDTVLISSEEFMRLGNYPKAMAHLARLVKEETPAGLTIEIISYVRAPDSHIRSWYNQLIKMGVRTPGFNDAVAGFIERVHLDYKVAIQPWVDIFGAHAVQVRPYLSKGVDGLAMPRDFFAALGVDVAFPKLKLPKYDPNPRHADDVTELRRVMQNRGLSPELLAWTETRVMAGSKRDAGLMDDGSMGFEEIQAQSAHGLAYLQTLPGNTVSDDDFSAMMLQPNSEAAMAQAELLGFMLHELDLVRDRVAKQGERLTHKVKQLEAQLAELKRGKF